jgi:hypothetical protein
MAGHDAGPCPAAIHHHRRRRDHHHDQRRRRRRRGCRDPAGCLFLLPLLRALALSSVLLPSRCTALHIGLVDTTDNYRTSSLFESGLLEAHGSAHKYSLVTRAGYCHHAVEPPTFLRLVTAQHMRKFCYGDHYCIVTGDETCKQPAHHPNVIARQYYSSKYGALPAISLGPRAGFKPVPTEDRLRGNRRYMFNFMGSVRRDGMEPDREDMQRVLTTTAFSVPVKLFFFDRVVKNPSNQDDYWHTLVNSTFTLNPPGSADDCFRFWEAVSAGSIPILVLRKHTRWTAANGKVYSITCPDSFQDVLASQPPVVVLDSWDDLPGFVRTVTEQHAADLRARLLRWNDDWWANTTRALDAAVARAVALRQRSRQQHQQEEEEQEGEEEEEEEEEEGAEATAAAARRIRMLVTRRDDDGAGGSGGDGAGDAPRPHGDPATASGVAAAGAGGKVASTTIPERRRNATSPLAQSGGGGGDGGAALGGWATVAAADGAPVGLGGRHHWQRSGNSERRRGQQLEGAAAAGTGADALADGVGAKGRSLKVCVSDL